MSPAAAFEPSDVPFTPGRPERTFRVFDVARADDNVFVASMLTGAWNRTPSGATCAGTLGVVVDVVLGSAVLTHRPAGSWAVSTEITIDVAGDIPSDGSVLRCTGQAVQIGTYGGLARGEVLDEQGRQVAIATQRQRFVPGTPALGGYASAGELSPDDDRDALTLLGGVLRPYDAGVDLDLPGRPDLGNPMGNVHGGLSLCASDLLGAIALDAAAVDSPLVTASVHIAYVRPMPGVGTTAFSAEILYRGRTFGIARVTGRSAAGRVCTVATVTSHVG